MLENEIFKTKSNELPLSEHSIITSSKACAANHCCKFICACCRIYVLFREKKINKHSFFLFSYKLLTLSLAVDDGASKVLKEMGG